MLEREEPLWYNAIMASTKNSTRRKRKYGEGQKGRTVKNKAKRKDRAELRAETLIERTQSIVGRIVIARTEHGLVKGKVQSVERFNGQAKRTGQYLRIEGLSYPIARRRVKVG